MTNPDTIAGRLQRLIAITPQPVTVYGVRVGEDREAVEDGVRYTTPVGHIHWFDSLADAQEWLDDDRRYGLTSDLVHITGRIHEGT